MVSPTLSLGHRYVYRFHGFVVSWFRGFAHSNILVIKMTVGFTVSWFLYFSPMVILHPSYLISLNDGVDETLISRNHGFVVSWFRPLPSLKMTVGFVVSRFHGFSYSVSGSPK